MRRLHERPVVGGEVIRAERVAVAGQQRQDLIDPALDVRLAMRFADRPPELLGVLWA